MGTKKVKRDLGFGCVLPGPLPDPLCHDPVLSSHLAAWDTAVWSPGVPAAHKRLVEEAVPSDAPALLAFLAPETLPRPRPSPSNPTSRPLRSIGSPA